MVYPSGKVVSYFGAYISGSLLNDFLRSQDTQYTNLKYFRWSLRSERGRNSSWKIGNHYLDNDAAGSAFIPASASTSLGTTLVTDYVNFEYKCRFSPWFARVASHSNPADQPSRLDFSPIWLRDAERFELVLPEHLSHGNQRVH